MQVKERSTHARPGMHTQQRSAVLTAVVTIQFSSVGSLFEIGCIFSDKTTDLHSTTSPSSHPFGPCTGLALSWPGLHGLRSGGFGRACTAGGRWW